jgi:hypothetical protein
MATDAGTCTSHQSLARSSRQEPRQHTQGSAWPPRLVAQAAESVQTGVGGQAVVVAGLGVAAGQGVAVA